MTIRLHCVECRRKLKVPDAALGKKVQCPVCGARFRGYSEASPPLAPTTDAETEAAPPPAPEETALIDALFAEVTPSSFSIPEDPAAPEEIIISASPPPLPAEAEAAEFEPLEPALVDEAVEEEMVEILDEGEAVTGEEAEPEEKEEKRANSKKKRGFFSFFRRGSSS